MRGSACVTVLSLRVSVKSCVMTVLFRARAIRHPRAIRYP